MRAGLRRTVAMAVAAPIHRGPKFKLLREACARNAAAELHYRTGDDQLVTARVRLLDVDAETIYTDRPQSIGKSVRFRERQVVVVHFLLSGTRYAFRARVVKPHCFVQLNANQRVPGMAIGQPGAIRPHQRRADFRMSLASHKVVAVIHRGSAEDGGSCPVQARPLKALLTNISAGGVCTVVDRAEARDWRLGDTFFVNFELPAVDDDFHMMAELRHTRPIHDGLSVVAGLKFRPWSLVRMRAVVRRITRFIASEQRRQLRRSR